MTETTPAQLRAAAEKLITPLGRRRLKLLADIEAVDLELKPFVLRARAAELPLRRIYELTGVSPNTIRAWERAAEAGG